MDSIAESQYPDRIDLTGKNGWVKCAVGTEDQFKRWFSSEHWNYIEGRLRKQMKTEMTKYDTGLWLMPWTEEIESRSSIAADAEFIHAVKVFSEDFKCNVAKIGWPYLEDNLV